MLTPKEREVWNTLYDRGRVALADLPDALGCDGAAAAALCDGLRNRRLVMRFDDAYVAVGATP